MCAHIFVSQAGLYQRGIWVEHPLTSLPFGLQGAFSVHVWWGRAPDFGNERYVVWAGLSSSFNYPAILVLEFLSIENESPTALPWGAHLPPASVVLTETHSFPCLKTFHSFPPTTLKYNSKNKNIFFPQYHHPYFLICSAPACLLHFILGPYSLIMLQSLGF